jgi:hypothetical protein
MTIAIDFKVNGLKRARLAGNEKNRTKVISLTTDWAEILYSLPGRLSLTVYVKITIFDFLPKESLRS